MPDSPAPGLVGALMLARLSACLALQPIRATTTARSATPTGLTGGPCLDWTNACTLQHPRARAHSSDWSTTGVHQPGASRAASVALRGSVALDGSVAGNEPALRQRDWQRNKTPRSGAISGDGLTAASGALTTAATRRSTKGARMNSPPHLHPA
jgi:hypothetical protein